MSAATAPSRSAPAVEAQHVSRTFGAFSAVDGVDLAVGPGEVVGLLGANGAGKTTLIKMLLGLLVPTSGRVAVFGTPHRREHRRRIGYVPQNLGLYPDLTVGENLALRAGVFGVDLVIPAAIAPRSDVPLGALPLGWQRQVAFAAAVMHRPALLVLDEPTSGVSPLARSRLWDLVREQAESGVAVIVSTHYMDEAEQADRLVMMAHGRVVAAGSAAAIIGDRTVVAVDTDRWQDAFDALDDGGHRLALSGRTVRVLGEQADGVAARLASVGLDATVRTVPATLDEALVAMST